VKPRWGNTAPQKLRKFSQATAEPDYMTSSYQTTILACTHKKIFCCAYFTQFCVILCDVYLFYVVHDYYITVIDSHIENVRLSHF